MKTKTLLPLAMILVLPITANATGPAAYSGNSPTVATASAPYQTVTPEAHADEHIASTQYVIGAYNDAIAAVNKVANDKQNKLENYDSGGGVDNVFGASTGPNMMGDYIATNTMEGSQAGQAILEDIEPYLLSAAGVIGAVGEAINLQRVLVYTSWENDNAKTAVPLANGIGWQNQIY